MYGIKLIFVLIVLGGVIAYIGDKIGRKVGRKKLTLFGLRPKYTSIIVTIITGIAVAAATLGILLAASQDVRNMLFKTQEIRETLSQKQLELSVKEDQLSKTLKELDDKEKKTKELSAELTVLTKRFEKKSQSYNALDDKYKQAQSEISEKQKLLGELRIQLEKSLEGLKKVNKDYSAAKSMLAKVEGELSSTRRDLIKSQDEVDGLISERQRLTTEITRLEDKEKTLITDIDELEKRFESLKIQSAQLYERYTQLSNENIIFFANQLILADVFDCGKSEAETKADLNNFLKNADGLAWSRGARFEGKTAKEGEAISFDPYNYNRTITLLREMSGRVVVQLISQTNVVQGKEVKGYIKVWKNDIIFKKGAIVTRRTIDGSLGKDYVDSQLFELISKANEVAIGNGMLSDKTGKVDEISGSDFLAIRKKILESATPVTLVIRTKEDVWRTQTPMQHVFELAIE